MNRGNWNLAKQAINRSKIGWALSTFKPFKSARTDGIVPALLQQDAEYLLPHHTTDKLKTYNCPILIKQKFEEKRKLCRDWH
jgi:hypothetical protein